MKRQKLERGTKNCEKNRNEYTVNENRASISKVETFSAEVVNNSEIRKGSQNIPINIGQGSERTKPASTIFLPRMFVCV